MTRNLHDLFKLDSIDDPEVRADHQLDEAAFVLEEADRLGAISVTLTLSADLARLFAKVIRAVQSQEPEELFNVDQHPEGSGDQIDQE